jgi:hypothetical protein
MFGAVLSARFTLMDPNRIDNREKIVFSEALGLKVVLADRQRHSGTARTPQYADDLH